MIKNKDKVPATPAQRSYVKALRDGRDLPAEIIKFYCDERIDGEGVYAEKPLTMLQASNAITAMKTYAFRANSKAEVQHAETHDFVTEEGIYERDGDVFDVVKSKNGHWYAKVLTETGFVYAGAAPTKALTPADKMTKERAQALSLQRSRCIRCGKQLSKQSSVDQGMGDICMSYFA